MDLIEELLKIPRVRRTIIGYPEIEIYKPRKEPGVSMTFIRTPNSNDKVIIEVYGKLTILKNLKPETILDLFENL